ncbi:MAG: Kelch repeat-containing protein [Bryobacteraceae bacterium]
MKTLVFLIAMASPFSVVWKDKTPMPRAEGGASSALVGDELIIAGGTNWDSGQKTWMRDVQIYNIKTDKWRMGPTLPSPAAYGPAVVTPKGMEILGGSEGQRIFRTTWRLEGQGWVETGAAPHDTQLGRAARVGESIYLLGGCSDVADLTRCTSNVAARKWNASQWESKAPLPVAGVAMGAVAVARGKIYYFGGCSMPSAGKLINRLEAHVYDPASNRWSRLHDLPRGNRALTGVAVRDRYIYLLGGFNATQEEAKGKGPAFGFTSEVWVYDIDTNNYTASTAMPIAVAGGDFFLHGDTIYGGGGEDKMKSRIARLVAGQLQGSSK